MKTITLILLGGACALTPVLAPAAESPAASMSSLEICLTMLVVMALPAIKLARGKPF